MQNVLKVSVGSMLGALLLLPAIGCSKPHGTCLPKAGKTCQVNARKDICEGKSFQGTFFEEPATAGLLRCKDAGFPRTITKSRDMKAKTDKGEMIVFLKPYVPSE